MRREPPYLYLTIAPAIVLMTSASPVSVLAILGVFTSAGCLMTTAYVGADDRKGNAKSRPDV